MPLIKDLGIVAGISAGFIAASLLFGMKKKNKRFAAVEAGGTTWLVAICEGEPTNVLEYAEFDTSSTNPSETLEACVKWLEDKDFDAIGIASFGPVDLHKDSEHYGFITSTPKPNWQYTDVVGAFKKFNKPIGFDTDVNAAAIAEAELGGHKDTKSCAYVTVGTGIGVGVVVDGKPLHGHMHPEAGHIMFPRHSFDEKIDFKGSCPFHGGCLEGMAASGAIADRLKVDRKELANLEDSDPVWDCIAHYLAHCCLSLTLTVSPDVIVLGGGVLKRTGLIEKTRELFVKYLNEYVSVPPAEDYIKTSVHTENGGLGAGLVGAACLAQKAGEKRNISATKLFQEQTKCM
eukprot:TRINITY_DN774054_c0_g1_i1.p1 TRINITY_DN774054_c0_g1~~TRINITY_DN774054_c0_g1_i1.p1  ORF type:complete len:346 (-),score=110.43 TRINITY_DN774054_c0_g1_i1:259-1296(-)